MDAAPTITALAAFIAALASFVSSLRNGKKVSNIHHQLNSELHQWMKEIATAAFARGVLEGKKSAKSVFGKVPPRPTIPPPPEAVEQPKQP